MNYSASKVTILNSFYKGNIYLDWQKGDTADKDAAADLLCFGGILGRCYFYESNLVGDIIIKNCISYVESGSWFAPKEDERILAAICPGKNNYKNQKVTFTYENNYYITGAGCMDWSQADTDTTGATEKKVSEL